MNAITKTVRIAAIIAPPMPDYIRAFSAGMSRLGSYGG
jgi:hypothetical protein